MVALIIGIVLCIFALPCAVLFGMAVCERDRLQGKKREENDFWAFVCLGFAAFCQIAGLALVIAH